MARYRQGNRDQLQFIQVDLGAQLVPGSLEQAIDEVVELVVDQEHFDQDYRNDLSGQPAYRPAMLIKVILAGYARGMISSRKLERACRENLVFMALAEGLAPDYSTIAGFIGRLGDRLPDIFAQVLKRCHEAQLLGGTQFSLDGMKLPGSASKRWSGKQEELATKEDKLRDLARRKIQEHTLADQPAAERAEQQAKQMKAQADRIAQHREEHGPKTGAGGQEVQGNVTDPDSAKMKTSHGVIQGYNAQALVDAKHQVITAALAVGHGQDYENLGKVMDCATDLAGKAGLTEGYYQDKELNADSSYHSEENLRRAEEHQLDVLIPDAHFRTRDQRYQSRHPEESKRRFGLEDFRWLAAARTYECPAGHALTPEAQQTRNQRGQTYRKYIASEALCRTCKYRTRCLQKNGRRRNLHVPTGEGETRCQKMRRKVDQAASRQRYKQRAATVEPVFGNLRYAKGMDRFTYRGVRKVNTQWALYCLVHNLEKLARYGRLENN